MAFFQGFYGLVHTYQENRDFWWLRLWLQIIEQIFGKSWVHGAGQFLWLSGPVNLRQQEETRLRFSRAGDLPRKNAKFRSRRNTAFSQLMCEKPSFRTADSPSETAWAMCCLRCGLCSVHRTETCGCCQSLHFQSPAIRAVFAMTGWPSFGCAVHPHACCKRWRNTSWSTSERLDDHHRVKALRLRHRWDRGHQLLSSRGYQAGTVSVRSGIDLPQFSWRNGQGISRGETTPRFTRLGVPRKRGFTMIYHDLHWFTP